MSELIKITEAETAALMREAGRGNPLPLTFGRNGVSLRTELAPWAVKRLAEMRATTTGVEKP